MRHEHFTVLRSAVTAHNGTVVKTTGVGLMLYFDSAADAVACAVAMQQATEKPGRQARRPVLSHVEGPAATNPSSLDSHEGRGLRG